MRPKKEDVLNDISRLKKELERIGKEIDIVMKQAREIHDEERAVKERLS